MNTEPIKHATFIVERTYPVDAARIFRAFSDTDIKRRWFAEGEDWRVEEFTADFRPAGYETSRFRYADGPPITNDTRYLDIVTDQRLVFSYVMTIDGRPSSASLASVELFPAQRGTPLVYTEQGSTSTAVTRRSSARSAAANCTTPSVRCWRQRTERDRGGRAGRRLPARSRQPPGEVKGWSGLLGHRGTGRLGCRSSTRARRGGRARIG